MPLLCSLFSRPDIDKKYRGEDDLSPFLPGGYSMLYYACYFNTIEVIKKIKDKVELPGGALEKGKTILHLLFSRREVNAENNEACLSLLITKVDDIDAVEDVYGFTALHMAILRKASAAAKCLIQHGANINIQAKDKSTPLMMAILQRQLNIASALLQRDDIDVSKVDMLGLSAADYAAVGGYAQLFFTLVTKGAPCRQTSFERLLKEPACLFFCLKTLLATPDLLKPLGPMIKTHPLYQIYQGQRRLSLSPRVLSIEQCQRVFESTPREHRFALIARLHLTSDLYQRIKPLLKPQEQQVYELINKASVEALCVIDVAKKLFQRYIHSGLLGFNIRRHRLHESSVKALLVVWDDMVAQGAGVRTLIETLLKKMKALSGDGNAFVRLKQESSQLNKIIHYLGTLGGFTISELIDACSIVDKPMLSLLTP